VPAPTVRAERARDESLTKKEKENFETAEDPFGARARSLTPTALLALRLRGQEAEQRTALTVQGMLEMEI
jgi:hypothetical protein